MFYCIRLNVMLTSTIPNVTFKNPEMKLMRTANIHLKHIHQRLFQEILNF